MTEIKKEKNYRTGPVLSVRSRERYAAPSTQPTGERRHHATSEEGVQNKAIAG